MLISFGVENFLSIKNEQVLSLKAGKGRAFNERVYKNTNLKILKFSSIFGANGSGKSNFVKAIAFARNYILNGSRNSFINKYYKIDETCKNTPSSFAFEILLDGNVINYKFSIILSTNKIISETLYKNKKLIFHRSVSDSAYEFNKREIKDNTLYNKLEVYLDGVKNDDNTLFLNLINQYKSLFLEYSEISVLKNLFNWYETKLRIMFPDEQIYNYSYFMSSDNIEKIICFFKDFGFSISNYDIVDCSMDRIAAKLPKEIYTDLIQNINEALSANENPADSSMLGINKELYIITKEQDELICKTIQLYHENPNIPFSMSEESDGTLRIFQLMEILFQNDDEAVYIIDEIDRCLHPLLTYNFVNAFLNKIVNSDCQLITTSHETLLLDFNLLRKDEMWLVTKQNGASRLEALGNTQNRADIKLAKSYLLGEKAIPKIKNDIYRINEGK